MMTANKVSQTKGDLCGLCTTHGVVVTLGFSVDAGSGAEDEELWGLRRIVKFRSRRNQNVIDWVLDADCKVQTLKNSKKVSYLGSFIPTPRVIS